MRRQPLVLWIAVCLSRAAVCVPDRFVSVQKCVSLGLLSAVCLSVGCANFHEKRTITAFQTGLESGDLASLQERSTDEFRQRALRHPRSDESLSQLKIPDGKFKITDVEDVSKTEKKITVAFGDDQKRKILYRLVRDEKTRSWRVDDIYLRQRHGDKVLAMAVTEQMDVLLSAREFYEAWSSGDRQQVLTNSNPELSQELAKLPPAVLANYISRMLGHSENSRSFKPETHINGENAVVRLNRAHGTLEITMEQHNSGWQVKDLSLKARGDDPSIESLTKTVKLTNQALAFLEAWEREDKDALQAITQSRFYQGGLAPANLSDLPLPTLMDVAPHVEVKLLETQADVVVNSEEQTVRLTLSEKGERTNKYEISDVVVYNLSNKQTLSLSAAMTARPVAEVFLDALRARDRKMLQFSSTMDFHKKTWNRVSGQTLEILPLPIIELETAEIVDTRFSGNVTQVIVEAGSQKLTLALHDQGGKVLVDDVFITALDSLDESAATSLKHHLSAVAPVYELAASIHNNDPQQTLRLVTDDFYDRVFSLAQVMPESSYQFLDYVSEGQPRLRKRIDNQNATTPTPMTANLIQPQSQQPPKVERFVKDEGDLFVEFTTPTGVMQVALRNEQGLFRVDDALLLNPDNQVARRLKQAMRMDIAASRSQNMIRTVSGEVRKLPKDLQTRKPSGVSRPGTLPGQALLADETTLTNALYEELDSVPGTAIQQAGLGISPPEDESPRPSAPQPPRQLPPGEHLLLKPIPID